MGFVRKLYALKSKFRIPVRKRLLLELFTTGIHADSQSDYRSPFYLFNGHLQTIVPAVLRKVSGVRYRRERIDTPDGDFLDLDWSRQGFANSGHYFARTGR